MKQASAPIHEHITRRISLRVGLFVFMFVAVAMMGLRIHDAAQDMMAGKAVRAIAPAQAASPAKEEKSESHKQDESKKDSDVAKEEEPDPINTDPVLDQDSYTETEVNVLKRLSERRQELDKRGRDIEQREALMKITEQRIDKKLNDMKAMQEEIRQMIGAANAEEQAKIDSMVKIYEIMKPKEAARIFDALDIGILVRVIQNMKEARVAPILAAMDAQKAKQVTGALMAKKQLPSPP